MIRIQREGVIVENDGTILVDLADNELAILKDDADNMVVAHLNYIDVVGYEQAFRDGVMCLRPRATSLDAAEGQGRR